MQIATGKHVLYSTLSLSPSFLPNKMLYQQVKLVLLFTCLCLAFKTLCPCHDGERSVLSTLQFGFINRCEYSAQNVCVRASIGWLMWWLSYSSCFAITNLQKWILFLRTNGLCSVFNMIYLIIICIIINLGEYTIIQKFESVNTRQVPFLQDLFLVCLN